MSKIKILEESKDIKSLIKSISNRGKKLERDIHKAAVSCLVHADKHNDVTLANRLIEAVPNGMRTNALRDWFLEYGKFTYDEENKILGFNKKAVTRTEEAIAKPFWDFKPEPEYKPFDLYKEIEKLVKKAQKRHDEPQGDEDNVPDEILESLYALVPASQSEAVN